MSYLNDHNRSLSWLNVFNTDSMSQCEKTSIINQWVQRWHKFQFCGQHFIIWEENSKLKQMHLPLLFHHFEENMAVHELYSVIQIQLNRWGTHTVDMFREVGGGVDRSLLALHLNWAELGQSVWALCLTVTHTHTHTWDLCCGRSSTLDDIQSLHRHVKIYFLHRNLDPE